MPLTMGIKFFSLLCFIQIANFAQGHSPSGDFFYDRLYCSALENSGGEDPTRGVFIQTHL